MSGSGFQSQVENFFQRKHRFVRTQVLGLHKKTGHLALPPRVYFPSAICALARSKSSVSR